MGRLKHSTSASIQRNGSLFNSVAVQAGGIQSIGQPLPNDPEEQGSPRLSDPIENLASDGPHQFQLSESQFPSSTQFISFLQSFDFAPDEQTPSSDINPRMNLVISAGAPASLRRQTLLLKENIIRIGSYSDRQQIKSPSSTVSPYILVWRSC